MWNWEGLFRLTFQMAGAKSAPKIGLKHASAVCKENEYNQFVILAVKVWFA